MFGFHVADNTARSVLEAVKFGFLAWALLALSMGIIFIVVLALNKIARKKKEEK